MECHINVLEISALYEECDVQSLHAKANGQVLVHKSTD